MEVRGEAVATILRDQAGWCRRLDSPLYAALLERAADDALAGGPTVEVLSDGSEAREDGDGALALRFMAAVHRLVLGGRAPELAAFYPSTGGSALSVDQVWLAFRDTLKANAPELRDLVAKPCQTNEAGRSAALLGGFLTVARDTGLPLRIVEIGASAGLNLRWDRFHYRAGDRSWGDPSSPVRLEDVYEGDHLPPFEVEAAVAERIGCDLDPIDPTSDEGALALRSSLWADQVRRFRILEGALEVARAVPVTVERADAAEWLSDRLGQPATGMATVVFHSVAMFHATQEARNRILSTFQEAGARATADAPLAWLRMEGGYSYALLRLTPHEVWLTTWPGGEERRLATAGAHGKPVRWRV